MSEHAPKKLSAWQEANGTGWLGIALFVVFVTAGALIFGTNNPKVAEDETPAQSSKQ